MSSDSLAASIQDAERWLREMHARKVFDMTVQSSHLKVAHEAAELADDPSLEEAADVTIAMVATCIEQRWSEEDLAAAIRAKVAVNRRRTWRKQPDGTFQHEGPAPL